MTKKILRHFPLKELHNTYGINWEDASSMKCYKHEGKFTINGIIKEFNLNVYDLIFISVQEHNDITHNRKCTIVLNKGLTTYSLSKSGCYRCYNKGTFEYLRKQDNISVYVASIDRKSLSEPKRHEWSLWNLTRFVDDINTRFIYKPSRDELFLNGYKYRTWKDRRDIEDALDKSGYSIIAKRRVLNNKLEEMHRNNLEKVIDTAFNKDNSNIFVKLLQAKEELAEQIKQATTSDEIRKLCNSLSEIKSLTERYEHHIEYLRSATNPEISRYYKYNSIKEVKDNLTKMNINIDNLLTILG